MNRENGGNKTRERWWMVIVNEHLLYPTTACTNKCQECCTNILWSLHKQKNK